MPSKNQSYSGTNIRWILQVAIIRYRLPNLLRSYCQEKLPFAYGIITWWRDYSKGSKPKKSDKAGETTQPEELTLAKGLGISSSAGLLYYQWTRSWSGDHQSGKQLSDLGCFFKTEKITINWKFYIPYPVLCKDKEPRKNIKFILTSRLSYWTAEI